MGVILRSWRMSSTCCYTVFQSSKNNLFGRKKRSFLLELYKYHQAIKAPDQHRSMHTFLPRRECVEEWDVFVCLGSCLYTLWEWQKWNPFRISWKVTGCPFSKNSKNVSEWKICVLIYELHVKDVLLELPSFISTCRIPISSVPFSTDW